MCFYFLVDWKWLFLSSCSTCHSCSHKVHLPTSFLYISHFHTSSWYYLWRIYITFVYWNTYMDWGWGTWVVHAFAIVRAREFSKQMILYEQLNFPCDWFCYEHVSCSWSTWIWFRLSWLRWSPNFPWDLCSHICFTLGECRTFERVLFFNRHYRLLPLALIIRLGDAYHLYIMIR